MSTSLGNNLFSERLRSRMGLGLAVLFAVVGLLFLCIPGGVLAFFNTLSKPLGLPLAPKESGVIFHALAVGYMYLVTLLAWSMFRQPDSRVYPLLLAHAKIASGIISLLLFVIQNTYLIYLANGIIDSLLGIGVLIIYRRCTA